jgi:hypothetical protein
MAEIDQVTLAQRAGPARPERAAEHAAAGGEQPLVSVEDVMTLEQARSLSGRRGARLVLLMGERSTGKTALIAMLWQQFLEQDGLDDHRLAGSRCARGLERRAHWARLSAAQPSARFPATHAEDEGVLHLRVRRPDGRRVELLLADLAGGGFEQVREGRGLLEALPWAVRADRFAVVLDAASLSVPGESEIAVTRARRLLLALAASGAVRDSARVALVLTKADSLSESGAKRSACTRPPWHACGPSVRDWPSWSAGCVRTTGRARRCPCPRWRPGAASRPFAHERAGAPAARLPRPAANRQVDVPRRPLGADPVARRALGPRDRLQRRSLLRAEARRSGRARRGARPHGA